MAEYKTLLIEDRGPVRLITLNQPKMFNPLDFDSGPELVAALEEAGVDESVRVLVLTGAGKAFAAGANLRLIAQEMAKGVRPSLFFADLAAVLHRSISSLRRIPKPVICAMNGVAAGGGMGWALACDMIVAAENARFEPGYIKIAFSPDGGSTAFFTRMLGLQRASDFFMRAGRIDAAQALEWGLVNRVVPADELMDVAMGMAQELAQGPAKALAATKELLNQAMFGDLETLLEGERQALSRLADMPDFAEGVRAFVEKRPPNFGK